MKQQSRKIVILFPELAQYFMACVQELSSRANTELYIFRHQVQDEAPFKFTNTSQNIHILNEDEYPYSKLLDFVKTIEPDLIYCAGWSNKKYLQVTYKLRKQCTTLFGFDTKWTGTLKQKISTSIAKIPFKIIFDFVFVPGSEQQLLAQKLGFNDDVIIKNAYSADFDHFNDIALRTLPQKKESFPKRFLFIGRYKTLKGIFDLWNAFIELQKEAPSDWELWCLGAGEEFENRVEHPKIKHLGFIQPEDMEKFLRETGIYILPSHFEPWGVSVHEMAAAGFPMILSDEIGAKEVFLEHGENGFIFNAHNVEELKSIMKKFTNLSSEQIWKMSESSRQLATRITPQVWADSLLQVFSKTNETRSI